MSLNINETNVINTAVKNQSLLTRAECEIILTKALSCERNVLLKEFSLLPAVYPSGFLGEYYQLIIHYTSNNVVADENKNSTERRELFELRAFVKRVPQANVEPEKEAIFRKEATLYVKLLERLRQYSTIPWSPRCFYARADLIVLEQLDTSNYTICLETVKYLSDHHMHQVLRSLAAQHASSIAIEVKEDICIGDTNSQLQQEITISTQVPWYTVGLKAILAVIKAQTKLQPNATQATIQARLPAAIESVYEMTNRSVKYRNVLCHRDIWRGNIFFSNNISSTSNPNEDAALFVDYQTARYCPPAIDVIFTLYMNLDQPTRKLKELEYLRFYYDYLQRDLSANGLLAADHITFMELLASYKEFELFGLLYRAIAATILNVPRQCVTNDYVHVERSQKVFELMDELPEFRKCLEERVKELLDYIIK